VSIFTKELILASLLVLLILTPAVSVGVIYSLYRKYYNRMKAMHRNAWFDLMRKDSAIEMIGEWYRWPFGSWYLMLSFFERRTNYDDEAIESYKRRGAICFKLFVVSLTISIILIILMAKSQAP
jgi:hypothetical protein